MENSKPNLNPMIRSNTLPSKPNWSQVNIRKSAKPRKTRVDKKHDIHIPLEAQSYKTLRKQAHGQRLSMTQYTTLLIQKAVRMDISLFADVDYRSYKTMARAKLAQYHYDELFNYALEWDISMRRTAHRVLMEMIKREEGRYR